MFRLAALSILFAVGGSCVFFMAVLTYNKEWYATFAATEGGGAGSMAPKEISLDNKGNELPNQNDEDAPIVMGPEEKKKCRKLILIMAKKMGKYMSDCIHQVRDEHPGKGEFDKYFQCSMKCSMKKVSMIDENDSFSNVTFGHFVTDFVKDEYHMVSYRLSHNCIRKFERIVINKEDPYCRDYGDIIKCMQDESSDKCMVSAK